jgi:putative two-component system response regulator
MTDLNVDFRVGRQSGPARGQAEVLAVVTDAALGNAVREILNAHGYLCEVMGQAQFQQSSSSARLVDAVIADLDGLAADELRPYLAAFHATAGEPAVIAIARADAPEQAQAAWDAGANGLLRKPLVDTELRFTLRMALDSRRLAAEKRALAQRVQQEVLKHTHELLDTIQRLESVEHGVRRSQEETIYRLSRAAEYRDTETGRHLQRMSQYSALLARAFGLAHDRAEIIRTASPMHDVGKIGTPDAILYKKGKHTPEETELMKQHAQIGYEILRGSQSELLDTAAVIAWTHHEKYDGSGYPRGLRGREIPLEGRIVAIADVFDALTSRRVYKPAFPVEQSQQMMEEGRGKHFDPGLLDLFWSNLDEILNVRSQFSDPELGTEAEITSP